MSEENKNKRKLVLGQEEILKKALSDATEDLKQLNNLKAIMSTCQLDITRNDATIQDGHAMISRGRLAKRNLAKVLKKYKARLEDAEHLKLLNDMTRDGVPMKEQVLQIVKRKWKDRFEVEDKYIVITRRKTNSYYKVTFNGSVFYPSGNQSLFNVVKQVPSTWQPLDS